MKLILAILIALSLVGSPGAAKTAPSASCTMAGAAEGKAAEHDDMPCCTTDCATPCPAAVLPLLDTDQDSLVPLAISGWQAAPASFRSITPSMVDPPPRAFFA